MVVNTGTHLLSCTCVIDIRVLHGQKHFLVTEEAINEISAAMQRNEVTKMKKCGKIVI